MVQIFKKYRVQTTIVICFCCLVFGLSAVNLSVSAKENPPYYIKVNKLQNCVTVYEQDENGKYTVPVRAMACSGGSATPLGTYKTLAKYRWKLLMGDVWGQYSTRIFQGILFHSVWYYQQDASTLSAAQYNKLGTTASHGCIRLTVEDAKWIYDNCKLGTVVEVYSDEDPGPLGKPETIKLKSGTGWDPTDPSEDNPFNDSKPSIKGASNKTIEWGTKINLLKGVKASSTAGSDITSKLEVTGDVDIYTAGKYKVTYSVTDAIGRVRNKKATITVKDCTQEPRFEGVTDRSIQSDTIVNREFALKGIKAYLATKRLSQKDIEVEILTNEDNTYSLKYSIVGENGLTGTAVAKAYIDTTAPVIEGITHKELTLKQLKAGKAAIKKIAMQGITVTDNYSKMTTENIKVSIHSLSDYAYIVTYKATDDAGNASTETVQFSYFKDTRIDGVKNHKNIPFGTEITEEFVSQGITASNSSGDCTDQITIGLGRKDEVTYEAIYYVPDEAGNTISLTAYYTVESNSMPEDAVDGDTEETVTTESEINE